MRIVPHWHQEELGMEIDCAINQEFFQPSAEFRLYLQDLNQLYALQDSGEGRTVQTAVNLCELRPWRKFDTMAGVE